MFEVWIEECAGRSSARWVAAFAQVQETPMSWRRDWIEEVGFVPARQMTADHAYLVTLVLTTKYAFKCEIRPAT